VCDMQARGATKQSGHFAIVLPNTSIDGREGKQRASPAHVRFDEVDLSKGRSMHEDRVVPRRRNGLFDCLRG
jgi:hypothetical protein